MVIEWSILSLRDIERQYKFIAKDNLHAAEQIKQTLIAAANSLLDNPMMGVAIPHQQGIRRLIVNGRYEVRYKVIASRNTLRIARIYHNKEDR